MESVLGTPPSEDNAGEMCFGECKDKIEKLRKDFLMLKKKIFCSQDLIKKYNNKIKENEQISIHIQTMQSQLQLTEKKLKKHNITIQSGAVKLQLENEKLRKSTEDFAKVRDEYEIKIASDKQYIQQLVCKLKELEDQNLDKLMKIELEKSGLQGKVKELEREIRNLRKSCDKTASLSPNSTNEPKKRGRKPINNNKTIDLPVLENDLTCMDIDQNFPEPLVSQCENTKLQDECKEISSTDIEVQKPIDVPEIILENEFKIKVSSLEDNLPTKPICIDKNVMTDEYYNLNDDPYPLFCHKCRNLLNSKPVDEILNGMKMTPFISELSRSPIHERNEISPIVHQNISINMETLENKFKKLERRVSKIKQVQTSYKNAPYYNHLHANSCHRDNSVNDSFSIMNMMTTFFNAMHSNKKKKKNRTKRLQSCRKKIKRRINNYTNNNWDVESLACDHDNVENNDNNSELLDEPIYSPLINRTKKNHSFRHSTNKNYQENLEEIHDHHTIDCNNVQVEKVKEVPKQSKKKQKNDNYLIKYQTNNDDYSENSTNNNNHMKNQQDNNDVVNDKKTSNNIPNTEETLDSNTSINDNDNNQIINTEKVNEIIPVEKPINNILHRKKHFSNDVNTRLNELYAPGATSIELISPPKLNKGTVRKHIQSKTNTNTVSVKSNLLTRLRQMKNRSAKLPAKIFRNEHLDNIRRVEEASETPIKKRRVAHVPKQDGFDDTNDDTVKISQKEELIMNRLRVTRSMTKSNLSPNTSPEKKSRNSLINKENSIINNITNVINDCHSFEQGHQKDNENSVMNQNQTTLNFVQDISEKTHTNDQNKKDGDKTQGLNNNCENEILSKSYELDVNNKEKSFKKVSKMYNTGEKTLDGLNNLKKLMDNEVSEGIALKNNLQLSNELCDSSNQKLKELPVLLEQKVSLTSPIPERNKSPIPPAPETVESSVPSIPKKEESPVTPAPETKEPPTSSKFGPEESPASPTSETEESPTSETQESSKFGTDESPASPTLETQESSKFGPDESPASPTLETEESLKFGPDKSPASPTPDELPVSLDLKHSITEIPQKLAMANCSNTLVTSNQFSKTPQSKNEFYKDCVINLRNRTVAMSPFKTSNDSDNKSFLQNNSSQSLLDQYVAQKKPKLAKKWSKFHHEAAMKLAKGTEEYVKMELKNLIDAETWTSSTNEQVVNNLKTINNRSIAKSVVEFLIELSNLKEVLDRTFTPPAPMMTKNQQKIVAMLKKLDGIKNIIIDVLNNIEYTIFRMHSEISYEAAEELARIFTVLAKIKKDRERVRIMCCDALYCLQKKGLFILSAIITSWPEVLPSHQEDRFQYLPACIAYAVKTFKHTPNDVCTKILQLNKLIRNIYKYPDEFLTSKKFAEKLLTDLMTRDYDRSVCTAIILLSKKEGNEWTQKNIINGGLLGMIVGNKSSNVREALKLLGYLMKSFPIIDKSGAVTNIIDQLCAILDSGATSVDIQEGVVFALLSLSRHNFKRVAESISLWQSPQNLSSELEEQLNIFFDLRTINFWKQFKKKKKCN